MTLEQLIERNSFNPAAWPTNSMVITVDDLLAWAIEQMEQGNLLPGATKAHNSRSGDSK
jgi:hypothetical protein